MYYVEAPYYIYHAECNTEKFVIFPTAESVVELKKASMIFFKKLNSEDLLPLLSFAIFIHHTPTMLCCLIFLSYIYEPQNYHKTNDQHKYMIKLKSDGICFLYWEICLKVTSNVLLIFIFLFHSFSYCEKNVTYFSLVF